ncbi:MAG: hypothetical protein ACKESB_01930 [Candidatus Hodgkinia cicadicola]
MNLLNHLRQSDVKIVAEGWSRGDEAKRRGVDAGGRRGRRLRLIGSWLISLKKLS